MNQELIDKVQAYVDKWPIEFDWDYNSELSGEDVDAILRGDAWKVGCEISENSLDWQLECERAVLQDAIEEFDLEMEPTDLLDYGVYVPVDVNLEGLIRNSNPYIGVDLTLEDAYTYAYSEPDYEDVEEELEFWGVNPQDVNADWPNIEREAKIAAADLEEAWLNAYYSGQWVALLDGAEVLEMALKGELEGKETVTLKAGANVTIYDFMNGAGSVIVPTSGDLEVRVKDIYNDGALRYGIQKCYGLVNGAWNGELEA
jgi:hypothetical protein